MLPHASETGLGTGGTTRPRPTGPPSRAPGTFACLATHTHTRTPCCLRTIGTLLGWLPPRSPAGHQPPELATSPPNPALPGEAGGGGGGTHRASISHPPQTLGRRGRLPAGCPRVTRKEQKVGAWLGKIPWVLLLGSGGDGLPREELGGQSRSPLATSVQAPSTGRASSTEELGWT